MQKTSRELLAERFVGLERDGLVDVKFFVRALDEAVLDDVCAEVNSLYMAREAGKSKVLDFGDATHHC